MPKHWLAISLGDPCGIGPEVVAKALAAEPEDEFGHLVVGDPEVLARAARSCGLTLSLTPFQGRAQPGRLAFLNPLPKPLPAHLAPGDPTAAQAALAWLEEAARQTLAGQSDGMVTAPLSKESILRLGIPFVGQTEHLTAMAGGPSTAMMLLGHDDRGRWLRVALATTHLPLKEVASQLTEEKILAAIRLASEACAELGLPSRRVAVCGLNPHAGEGGRMGTEEGAVIAPAIQRARGQGLSAEGPFPADTLFHQVFQGRYEAVVAMYHDQGLVPLKMVAFDTGVNWTLGLPFTRTSPDHGTAQDIAGQGIANPSSMGAAIALAKRLTRRRLAGQSPEAPGQEKRAK